MTTVEDVLAHHGVRGMKWGVRNARNKTDGQPTKRQAKKLAKADVNWQKNVYSFHGAIAVHNKVADKMNNGVLDELNNRPEFKKHIDQGNALIDIHGNPLGKIGHKYVSEYNNLVAKHTAAAVKEVHGVSPSGKLKATLDTTAPGGWRVKVSPTNVQHGIAGMNDIKPEPISVPNTPELLMDVNHDDFGMVTSHKKIKTPVVHSDAVEMHLEHYGIKGMHWGVRTGGAKGNSGGSPTRTTYQKPPKHLSDTELNKRIKRMELEKKYSELNTPSKSKGKKYVHEVLGNSGKTAAGAVVGGVTTFAVQKALKKTFGG